MRVRGRGRAGQEGGGGGRQTCFTRCQGSLEITTDKVVCYWYKNKWIDQWNRIENPERDPYTARNLLCSKGDMAESW